MLWIAWNAVFSFHVEKPYELYSVCFWMYVQNKISGGDTCLISVC